MRVRRPKAPRSGDWVVAAAEPDVEEQLTHNRFHPLCLEAETEDATCCTRCGPPETETGLDWAPAELASICT